MLKIKLFAACIYQLVISRIFREKKLEKKEKLVKSYVNENSDLASRKLMYNELFDCDLIR